MKKIMTATIASLALLTACGGDSGDSGDAGRETITSQLLDVIATDGGEVDESCVRDVVDKLSDADVEAIVAAGPDGDPDVSPEAENIGMELVSCVTDFGDSLDSVEPGDVDIPEGVEVTDAMVDAMVSQMEASGLTVDRDCIGEALEGQDLAALAENAMTPEVLESFMGCVTP